MMERVGWLRSVVAQASARVSVEILIALIRDQDFPVACFGGGAGGSVIDASTRIAVCTPERANSLATTVR